MNATSNRWQVALRVFISVLLLALSLLISSNFVSAQTDSNSTPKPGTTYVVQPNDTLARIAAYAYDDGTLYEALCTYNQLEDCHSIVPGTVLVIPSREELNLPPVPTPTPSPTAVEPADDPTPVPTVDPMANVPPELRDNLYLVQAGDSLESIATAQYNNASLAGRLCVFNMLPDCSLLEPGSRIFTPAMDVLLFGEGQPYLPPETLDDDTGLPTLAATVETVEVADTPVEPAADTAEPDTSSDTPPDSSDTPPDDVIPTPEPTLAATVPAPTETPAVPVPTPQVPTNLTLAAYLEQDPRFEIYAYALTLSTLGDLLARPGPYTLLVPSDAAWVQAETGVIKNLLISAEVLTLTLRSHIIQGDLSYAELASRDEVTSISGVVWPVVQDSNGDLLVGNVRVSGTSTAPTNGTIHILSALLYP